MARNETAPKRRLDVLGPPGPPGKKVFFKATRTHALTAQILKENLTKRVTTRVSTLTDSV